MILWYFDFLYKRFKWNFNCLNLICFTDCKSELKILKDHIRDSEDQRKSLDQDLKDIYLKRDEAKLEYERLNEGIRQSRVAHDDYMRQEKTKQSELQELLKNVNDKSIEYQEAKMVKYQIFF